MIGGAEASVEPSRPSLARARARTQRLLIGALGDGDALHADQRRAMFIIVNMYARPRFSSPTR